MTKQSAGFSTEERAAMVERARELRAEAKMEKNRAEGEKAVRAAIAKMGEPDRLLATKIHELVSKNAPTLMPKTWYGMPAYADNDGKVVCFFQNASKFKARYATLGFNDTARLDEGSMWPTSFAVKKLGMTEEKKIVQLVKRAVKN